MDSKLFNAILSMDSYNRGYGAAVDLRPRDADGNLILDIGGNPVESDRAGIKIGNATISLNSTTVLGDGVDQAVSFYAIAYEIPNDATWNGQTIISYRGTDFPLGDGDQNIGSDVAYGYSIGTGDPVSSQGDMAIGFYKAVAGSEDLRTANISFTGHSLGGGLAGLVGVNDNVKKERAAA
jgi:hypothetical protein